MKQKKKIRKRKHTTPTEKKKPYILDGELCAKGTRKLGVGNRPWLSVGHEFFP